MLTFQMWPDHIFPPPIPFLPTFVFGTSIFLGTQAKPGLGGYPSLLSYPIMVLCTRKPDSVSPLVKTFQRPPILLGVKIQSPYRGCKAPTLWVPPTSSLCFLLYSTPAGSTRTSPIGLSVFFDHARHAPASGPLHLLLTLLFCFSRFLTFAFWGHLP